LQDYLTGHNVEHAPDKTSYALPKVMPRGVISAEIFIMGTKGKYQASKETLGGNSCSCFIWSIGGC